VRIIAIRVCIQNTECCCSHSRKPALHHSPSLCWLGPIEEVPSEGGDRIQSPRYCMFKIKTGQCLMPRNTIRVVVFNFQFLLVLDHCDITALWRLTFVYTLNFVCRVQMLLFTWAQLVYFQSVLFSYFF
jgi:hypothetical protein